MNYLIVDTSSKCLYVGIRRGEEVFEDFSEDCGLQHSQVLISKVDALIKRSGCPLKEMDCFACCVGPGSFTGIRIGLTTVRAFCQVFEKPILAVNSLWLKAYNVEAAGVAVPLIDAVRGKFYCAAYLGGKEIAKPRLAERGALENFLKDIEQKSGQAAYVIYEGEPCGIRRLEPSKKPPYIRACDELLREGKATHYSLALPAYAALSQAEENYGKNKAVD
ncbi:MAG: tRNA (adenosine(37)-N6)-threonylcarbamoyltransferase complex dimerization subunit type 1 TsaB [Clostridiales bacterium]|nr:tRNA (adenosine(37)-N6)-threonylcarbamoyltransferase complex dimerization subunit type 1 TsaB [Clostridiales bacterium]